MQKLKLGAALALLVGLALTVGLVAYVGVPVLVQAAGAVGPAGFFVYTAYNFIVFALLGLAWWAVAPGVELRASPIFVWARVLREAASDVLPFAQVTGLLVAIRAVSTSSVGEALAVASLIADLTTEMAAQLVYTLFGVALLLATLAHATGARTLALSGGAAFLVGGATLAAFLLLQGKSIDLVAHLAGRWLKDTRARADAVRGVLSDIYRSPARVAGGFLLHAAAWVAGGVGSYIALHLMGEHTALWRVLTLESLMAAVRSVAFISPGALGVQEGAYVLAAPLLGITPAHGLALSLLKRAKDLAIGVPALLYWQAGESRSLLRRARRLERRA